MHTLYSSNKYTLLTSGGITVLLVVVACQELGLTVSESKIGFMRLRSVRSFAEIALHTNASGQRYKQTAEFAYRR